ncbi:hypothetical protein VYU27_006730, partial [Nannochloropsis oceanica]
MPERREEVDVKNEGKEESEVEAQYLRSGRRSRHHAFYSHDQGDRRQSPNTSIAGVASSCVRCRRSKTRCNGTVPCQRCFRLALSCYPQFHSINRRGRHGHGHRRDAGAPQADGETTSSKGGRTGGLKPASCLVDLAIKRVDPLPMTQLFLSAFHQLYRQNKLDRAKLIPLLYVASPP